MSLPTSAPLRREHNGLRLARCLRSGYWHLDPIPTQEALQAYYRTDFYDAQPDYFVRNRADERWHRLEANLRYDDLERLLPATRRRLLEIGSGPGLHLQVGLERGWEVLGIEPGEQAYRYSAEERGLPVRHAYFHRGNHRAFGTFDAIYLRKVLEHVPDPHEMLDLIHAVLEPGGLICLNVPNEFNPFQEAVAEKYQREPWWVVEEHINYFDLETLGNLVEAYGFEIETRTTDFPMELFALMGFDYTRNDTLVLTLHHQRVAFEMALAETGRRELLERFYTGLASAGLGRCAIITARKVEEHRA
jgi:SAM-dependent methyltransferase